jgi:hypothetical protein
MRIEYTMSNMPCPERLWQPLDEDMLRSGKLPPMLWGKIISMDPVVVPLDALLRFLCTDCSLVVLSA